MLPLLRESTPPEGHRWWWETLPNPNLLSLHSRLELTHAMSEKYKGSVLPPDESWLHLLLRIDGIEGVDVLRHHLRLRKQRNLSWEPLLPLLQESLGVRDEHWLKAPPSEEQEQRQRDFDWPMTPAFPVLEDERPLVFEGVDVASEHSLARELFAFPGLVMIRLSPTKLLCKRALPFSWEELQPAILPHLS